MFLTLVAIERARRSLEASAPLTCAAHGGAEALMRRLGGRMVPHERGWWSVDFTSPEGQLIWGQMCQEQQGAFREGAR